jgi:hypothetical protein
MATPFINSNFKIQNGNEASAMQMRSISAVRPILHAAS